MSFVRIAIARMRALFRRDVIADEISEELQFHVDMRADEYARNGLDAEAARKASLRRFGNLSVIRDRGYDVRGGGVLESMIQVTPLCSTNSGATRKSRRLAPSSKVP